MEIKQAITAAALVSSLLVPMASAATGDAPENVSPPAVSANATPELDALTAKINAKVAAGQNTEQDLAPELKQFAALLTAHPNDRGNAVAQIAYARAKLYATTLHAPRAALPMYHEIVTGYPGTAVAQEVAGAIPALEQKIANDALHHALAIGTQFPDFTVKDLHGQPLSPANYQGKILLIEFWAAWCPDCHAQMPGLLATYNKYHSKGFDIIGVSLDQTDERVLTNYLKENKIPWPQYYDGQYWDNALAVKYGVHFTPQNYLLDGHGAIIGKELQGAALNRAVQQALAAVSKPGPAG